MNIHVKIFPIAGLCNQSQDLELALENGSLDELLVRIQKRLDTDTDLRKTETLMFLYNGRVLDKHKDVVLSDGGELWLLPLLSGG